jgi:hypothetical protein
MDSTFWFMAGKEDEMSNTPNIRRFLLVATDFASNTGASMPPLSLINPAAGTCVKESTVADAGHPGVVSLKSSASANSGALWYAFDPPSIILCGGEVAELIFKLPAAPLSEGQIQFGYTDGSPLDGLATDGVHFWIVGTTVTGKTADNNVRSTTGTSYTLTGDTWYHLKLVVNDTATRVDFYVYDASGAVLWTDYLDTNIPTGAGRYTQVSMGAIRVDAAAATQIVYLDAMVFYGERDIR